MNAAQLCFLTPSTKRNGAEDVPCLVQEESGYTREEWMDFFAEEGLSADELKALDQIFDYLNLSGDIPVAARQGKSLEFSHKRRVAM